MTSAQSTTAVPPGVCLAHGSFVGFYCPRCCTAVIPPPPTTIEPVLMPPTTIEPRITVTADRYDWADDPTAQDVIDAMRIAVLAQDDPEKIAGLVKCLIEFAPETDSSRGIDLLLRLVSEATLKLEMVDHG